MYCPKFSRIEQIYCTFSAPKPPLRRVSFYNSDSFSPKVEEEVSFHQEEKRIDTILQARKSRGPRKAVTFVHLGEHRPDART